MVTYLKSLATVFAAALVVALVATVLGTGYFLVFDGSARVKKGAVVELTVGGSVNSLPQQHPFARLLTSEPLSLWELERLFRSAAQDPNVSGISLEIQPLLLSWAQIETLRDYMHGFRAAGKPIHAFLALDMLRDPELYLASAADSITLNPDAGVLVNGLMAEMTFFKGTMEKLGVRPEFIQFKEFKSAEVYQREEMSPEIRQMYESVLNDIQDRFVREVSAERGVAEEGLRHFISAGVHSANRALETKLVDTLGYRADIQSRFREAGTGYQGLGAGAYLKATGERFQISSEHKVALLGAGGTIISGSSDPFSQTMGGATFSAHLRKIREKKLFKGVILWVDSPGGSAVGSDMVWKEVRALEESGIPVVVLMSSVAGSGGYYISMAARRIVSRPSTITGSIGVIFGKFDLLGLYQWLGATVDRVKTAPNADILSPFSGLSDEQTQGVTNWMETIYKNFVGKAAAGRKVTYEELEPKARGRIYTGAQAQEIGLVDRLGGLKEAIEEMKEALGLAAAQNLEVVLYPPPKGLWATLTSGSLIRSLRGNLLSEWLERNLSLLSQPRAWLLMPELNIH